MDWLTGIVRQDDLGLFVSTCRHVHQPHIVQSNACDLIMFQQITFYRSTIDEGAIGAALVFDADFKGAFHEFAGFDGDFSMQATDCGVVDTDFAAGLATNSKGPGLERVFLQCCSVSRMYQFQHCFSVLQDIPGCNWPDMQGRPGLILQLLLQSLIGSWRQELTHTSPQGLGHGVAVGKTLPDILFHRLVDNPGQAGWQFRANLADTFVFFVHDFIGQRRHAFGLVGQFTGKQLIERHTQRKQVRPAIHLDAGKLLGRHVGRAAEHSA